MQNSSSDVVTSPSPKVIEITLPGFLRFNFDGLLKVVFFGLCIFIFVAFSFQSFSKFAASARPKLQVGVYNYETVLETLDREYDGKFTSDEQKILNVIQAMKQTDKVLHTVLYDNDLSFILDSRAVVINDDVDFDFVDISDDVVSLLLNLDEITLKAKP